MTGHVPLQNVPQVANGRAILHFMCIAANLHTHHESAATKPLSTGAHLDEGDGTAGPHADQPGRAPLAVHQAPVLPAAHGLLQDACRHAARPLEATCG